VKIPHAPATNVEFTTQWQGNYAAFFVSQSNLEQLKQDIAAPEEHHREVEFQDEWRTLLRQHEIEWDEKCVQE
jgi:hypothetical protein